MSFFFFLAKYLHILCEWSTRLREMEHMFDSYKRKCVQERRVTNEIQIRVDDHCVSIHITSVDRHRPDAETWNFYRISQLFFLYTQQQKSSTLSSSRTHTQQRMPHHFFSEREGKFNVERGGGKLRLQRREKRSVRVNLFESSRQSWEEKKAWKISSLEFIFIFEFSSSFHSHFRRRTTQTTAERTTTRAVCYIYFK